jgi:hypothetical protein
MSLYTDRGSHYFRTTKAGEIDRGCPAQAGKALAQLCVEHIGAFSPQARGHSQRAFPTLQDRRQLNDFRCSPAARSRLAQSAKNRHRPLASRSREAPSVALSKNSSDIAVGVVPPGEWSM